MATTERKRCTNLGCGQTYEERDNDGLTNACVHHWGQPFFHDAYKGWTCCAQKSTDFTTFLNFKGCKRGKHSDVTKHVEKNRKPEVEQEVEVEREERDERDREEEENKERQFQFKEELWSALRVEEAKSVQNSEQMAEEKRGEEEVQVLCKKCHKRDVTSKCVFHCGQTIFHDSLKYWTCCPKKKFTDFQDFEQLEGCQEAPQHEMEVRVPKPREDWFQSSDSLTLVFYGVKGARALKGTEVKTNGKCLRAVFCDKSGNKLFEKTWVLKDFVFNSDKSVVLLEKTKVEIHLEKVIKNHFWSQLESK